MGPRLKAAVLATLASGLMVVLRLYLRLRPYRSLERFLPKGCRSETPGWVKTRTARALALAARRSPRDNCLAQALTGQFLLAWQGYASTVRIGVAQGAETGFRAHAWLVVGDDVLVGDDGGLAAYQKLTDLKINHG